MDEFQIEIHHREENDDDLLHDEDDDLAYLWAVEGARVLALTVCIPTSRHPEPNQIATLDQIKLKSKSNCHPGPNQIKVKIKLPP